jgi:hypothetical protein
LPVSGTYAIGLGPQDSGVELIETVQIALNGGYTNVNTGAVTIGGASSTFVASTTDTGSSITFSGLTGQEITIDFTGYAGNGNVYAAFTNPDGSAYWYNGQPGTWTTSGAGTFNATLVLPQNGVYTIGLGGFIPGNTGWAMIETVQIVLTGTLSNANTGTVVIGGASSTIITGTPVSSTALTFSGTTGQNVGITFTGYSGNPSIYVWVVSPDSSLFQGMWIGASTYNMNLVLPQTGTYTMDFYPNAPPVQFAETVQISPQ